MTLEEHILKAENDANMAEFDTEWGIGNYFIDRAEALEYAKECRQLAEWLKELKQLKEQTRWIPVSERLPKAGECIGDVDKYYLVQNEYGDMLVARYTHSEYWEQIYQFQPIGDKIVAWMPLPEPWKGE